MPANAVASETVSYDYDPNGRLVRATYADGRQVEYVYDANGNELSRIHTKAHCDNGVGNGADCRPGMARFNNDDVGGVPGDPGAKGGVDAGT